MNVRKYFVILALLMGIAVTSGAQPLQQLQLQDAYRLLEQRYPLQGDTALLRQIQASRLELNELERLPVIRWRTDGRLQSTSTRLVSDNPQLPLQIDQPLVNLRTYLEADYLLLDGGNQSARRTLIELEQAVARGELEVQIFALRKIINQHFLMIHHLRAQEQLLAVSLADMAARADQLQAGIRAGVILESEQRRLEVKILELQAQRDNLLYQLSGTIHSLADWLGVNLEDDFVLEFPDWSVAALSQDIHRPELQLFEQRKELVFAQSELIDGQLRPRLSVFAQGGLGYPNPLNILDNQVAPYGLAGVGLSWTLVDWDKTKTQKTLLTLEARRIEHAAQSFAFRIGRQRANYEANMARLNQQIKRQEAIVLLQKDLLVEVTTQLEAGVLTATDYLLQVNAELAARQQIAVLEAERQAVQLNYWNDRGAF